MYFRFANMGNGCRWIVTATVLLIFSGMLWAQIDETKVTLPDAQADELFGTAVDIYGDTAIVGTPMDGTANGSAAIFRNSPNGWVIDQKLTASDTQPVDLLGGSVAIYGDIVAVGAIGDDDMGLNAGAVYIYRHVNTQWEEVAKITASDGQAGDNFGRSVAIYDTRLVVGAPSAANDTGAVYFFNNSFGDVWTEYAKLVPTDGEPGDEFGWDTDIWGDYMVVGSPDHDAYGSNTGAIYIYYEAPEAFIWLLQDKVGPSNAAPSDSYGHSVSIFNGYALVGAPFADPSGYTSAGAAYILKQNGVDWDELLILTDDIKTPDEFFGYSASLSDTTAIIGIPNDGQLGGYDGAAAIYVLDENGWTKTAHLTASDGTDGADFGWSVAIDGESSIIGAPRDDANDNNSGSTYITNGTSQPPLLVTIIAPPVYTSRTGCAEIEFLNTTNDSVIADVLVELEAPGGYTDTLLSLINFTLGPQETDTLEECFHLPWNVSEGSMCTKVCIEGITPSFNTCRIECIMHIEFINQSTASFIIPDNLCAPAPLIHFEITNTTGEETEELTVDFYVTNPGADNENKLGTKTLYPLESGGTIHWALPLFQLTAPTPGTYVLRASGGQEECEVDAQFTIPHCPSGSGTVITKEGSRSAPLGAPVTFSLEPNSPNPFNPTTKIQFGLPVTSHVELTVYDVLGREVRTLVDGHLDAAYHQVIWDGKDSSGNPVASGIYVYRIQAGEFSQSHKMMLSK